MGHPVPILSSVGAYNAMHKCMEARSACALNIDTYLTIRNASTRRRIASWRPGTTWRCSARIAASTCAHTIAPIHAFPFSFHAGYHLSFRFESSDLSIRNAWYRRTRRYDKNSLRRMRHSIRLVHCFYAERTCGFFLSMANECTVEWPSNKVIIWFRKKNV